MKFALKVIIVFLIVFNFKITYTYNSVFLAVGLTAIYYITTQRSIPLTYFSQRYNVILLVSTLLLCFVAYMITELHGEGWYHICRRLIVQTYMLGSMMFVMPLIIGGRETEAFKLACEYLSYAFALQGLIHILGYVYNPFGEFIMSLKPAEMQAAIRDPHKNIDAFRGYALTGSIFFELPCAYGVAFMAFMRLQLMEGQKYIRGYMSYIVFTLMILGVMLSGRVGFIGVALGIGLFFMYVIDPIVIISSVLRRAAIILPVLLIIYFGLLSSSQRSAFETQLFRFAFEAVYRWVETGHFVTVSSNTTIEGFYFPLKDETILFGHGFNGQSNEMYTWTDAGYMRSLIFGGVIYLFCQIVYQWLYFIRPISIAKSRKDEKEGRIDMVFFIFLFLFMLIVHIKDSALGVQHLTESIFVLLGSSYITRHYAKLEFTKQNEEKT